MNTNINKRRKNNEGERIVHHHHHVPTTITDLPETMIHHITSSLSLRDITRMSLCFKQWRYLCYTTPYLIINIDELCQNSTIYHNSFIFLIIFLNKLLIYRHTNVQRLALTYSHRFDSLRKCGFIDTLILKAIEGRLQELDLSIDIDNEHEWLVLPGDIFTLPSLTIFKLKLNYSQLNLPHSVQWPNLHTLSFTHVVFAGNDPLGVFPNDTSGASFLNRCPSLKTLTLEDCKGFTTLNVISSSLETLSITHTRDIQKSFDHLNISCDKLKTLYLNVNSSEHVAKSLKLSTPILDSFQCKGVVWKSCILNPFTSFKAMDATIHTCSRVDDDDVNVGGFVLDFVCKLLDYVSHATFLHLCNQSMQVLHSKMDETPSFFLFNLEFLTLFTHTLSAGDSCSIMYILQRSPKMKTLRIIEDYMVKPWFRFKPNDDDNEYQQQTEFFHNLKLVEMSLIGDGEANLELLKNLLKNGKALEQITIYYRPVPESSIPKRFSKKLSDFQKTSSSPLARLCFLPVWS